MSNTAFKPASLTTALVAAGLLALSPVVLADHHDHGHDDHGHDDHGHDDHGHDQLGAHVHGAAQLQVALDHDHVDVFLDSPSINVVGFEHMAHDEADRETLRAAEQSLTNADNVFVLTRSAQCALENVSIDSEQLDDMHDDHGHDDHGHDHADGSVHSEFQVSYRFHCDQPDNLIGLHATVFENFPGFEELDVQWIVDGEQGSTHVRPGRESILFRN